MMHPVIASTSSFHIANLPTAALVHTVWAWQVVYTQWRLCWPCLGPRWQTCLWTVSLARPGKPIEVRTLIGGQSRPALRYRERVWRQVVVSSHASADLHGRTGQE